MLPIKISEMLIKAVKQRKLMAGVAQSDPCGELGAGAAEESGTEARTGTSEEAGTPHHKLQEQKAFV